MPSDTPDSPGAGGVFSGGAASKPPEAENLPCPFGGRPVHVPSDAIRQGIELSAAASIAAYFAMTERVGGGRPGPSSA